MGASKAVLIAPFLHKRVCARSEGEGGERWRSGSADRTDEGWDDMHFFYLAEVACYVCPICIRKGSTHLLRSPFLCVLVP